RLGGKDLARVVQREIHGLGVREAGLPSRVGRSARHAALAVKDRVDFGAGLGVLGRRKDAPEVVVIGDARTDLAARGPLARLRRTAPLHAAELAVAKGRGVGLLARLYDQHARPDQVLPQFTRQEPARSAV